MLISAMWLLLLGTAVAALLMQHAMTTSRDLGTETQRFEQDHAQADAIETIAADLVFSGQRSRWSQLPASDTITVDGRSVAAMATSEEQFADVNKTDLRRIEGTLQDHGFDAAARNILIGRMAVMRSVGRKVRSYAELVSVAAGVVPAGTEDCLLEALSPFGGMGEPGTQAPIVRPGTVVRLDFQEGARRHLQTFRLVAANDRPYALLDDYDTSCPRGRSA